MVYPAMDPVALDFGAVKVHWYGLMYLCAFLTAWALARARSRHTDWTADQLADLIFYGALGLMLGGRLGYILFYNVSTYADNPWAILKIWEGGMSFHGGLIGGLVGMVLYARRFKRSLFVVMDFVAPLIPLGLGFGRLGNFINGELWGKVTDSPWGMVMHDPLLGTVSRYPSQLYEAFLEGLVLFLIVWWYSAKKRPLLAVSAVFFLGYGLFRFLIEFVRVPDAHIGYLSGWLTMGQLLSLPMIVGGTLLLRWAYRQQKG